MSDCIPKVPPAFRGLQAELEIINETVNTALNAMNVTDVSPAELITMGPLPPEAFTAPGSSDARDVEEFSAFGYAVTVSTIDTSVLVDIIGSNDNTNYSTLEMSNAALPGGAVTANQMTITANGTYVIWARTPIKYIKFRFVSEIGGTAAAISTSLFARRN